MSQTPDRLPTHSTDAASPEAAQGEGTNSVLVGEIVASFGVRGQVKMVSLMDAPATLTKLPFVTIQFPHTKRPPETHPVVALRIQKNVALVTLEGISDRDAAESLRGSTVHILESELPPLGPDTYYERELVGLHVVTEAGRDLGQIEKVHFYPANDVYETPVALIPAVEAFIVNVDLAGGRMVVRDVAGLRKDE